MRTTIDLDDDLVLIAKQLAVRRGMTMGQIIFIPKKGAAEPSMTLVNRLRDGE